MWQAGVGNRQARTLTFENKHKLEGPNLFWGFTF